MLEYDETLGTIEGRLAEAKTLTVSDCVRWWYGGIVDVDGEGESTRVVVDELRASCLEAGGGRAPAGLLIRLVRRPAR